MDFVLIDESTAATADDAHGGPLTELALARIAVAMEVQLNRDVAPEWGGNYRVRVGSGPGDVVPGEIVCLVVDQLPGGDSGAIAYHSVDGADHPLVYAARAGCTSVMSSTGSLSSAISHELVETAVDQSCNVWADNGDGTEYAQEACDPTESDGYPIEVEGQPVSVSNFTLRSYFGVGTPSPWTFLGAGGSETVPGPFGLAPGGYVVKRPVDESSSVAVFGEVRPERKARIDHPSSRVSRRTTPAVLR